MNKLTSSLPLEINNLTNFISQQLGYNNFIGHLPQHICQARSLEYVGAINNHFIGPIPKSLKNCTSLVRVRFDGNQLTGNITEDFRFYPNLNYIDLSDNNLYGELSSNWGKWHKLTSLKVSNSKIIFGNIPPKLLCDVWKSLTYYVMHENPWLKDARSKSHPRSKLCEWINQTKQKIFLAFHILYDAEEIKICLIPKDVWAYDKMHEIQNLHE